jgi:hypothetical protein
MKPSARARRDSSEANILSICSSSTAEFLMASGRGSDAINGHSGLALAGRFWRYCFGELGFKGIALPMCGVVTSITLNFVRCRGRRNQPLRELCTTKEQVPGEEVTLTTNLDQARARAEKSFKQEERAKQGAEAMMEYQANSESMREKTERLRALRLAKEAADRKKASS